MRIQRLSLKGGSRAARGTTVVIDVFRAFTCEPLLFHYGAERVFLEADIERCLAFRGNAVLVGEMNELPIEGFDLTNSPVEIMRRGRPFFAGKTVIHRTTAGITGALAAMEHSDEVLLASFLTARATAEYIRRQNPELVSIVAMGIRSLAPAPEDEFCGDYIESMLTEKSYDHTGALQHILAHETAQKFLRGDKEYLPREDPAIALQRDLFDFALRARQGGQFVEAEKVMP